MIPLPTNGLKLFFKLYVDLCTDTTEFHQL